MCVYYVHLYLSTASACEVSYERACEQESPLHIISSVLRGCNPHTNVAIGLGNQNKSGKGGTVKGGGMDTERDQTGTERSLVF